MCQGYKSTLGHRNSSFENFGRKFHEVGYCSLTQYRKFKSASYVKAQSLALSLSLSTLSFIAIKYIRKMTFQAKSQSNFLHPRMSKSLGNFVKIIPKSDEN